MRILVLHDRPADISSFLESECQGHTLVWACSGAQVTGALAEFRPEIVFSIKHSGFPGPEHQPAVDSPSVRWFQIGGSGYEHLGAWDSRRVQVTNSAGVLASFHAERAMAALLYITTGLDAHRHYQQNRSWVPTRFQTLAGRTALVIGLGATGSEFARKAKAFDMRVWGVKRSAIKPSPWVNQIFSPEELPDLWAYADVVSLNIPASPQTRGLLDRQAFARLPHGAILLNGARASLVEEEPLLESLKSGALGGAWLDVFDREPLPSDSPFWSMPNVVLTPHCADQVADFPLRFARFFVQNLRRFEQGQPLQNLLQAP